MPLSVEAQPPKKAAHVGYLSPSSRSDPRTRSFVEAFRQGLQEFGWIEGQNVTIEYRWAEEKSDRLSELARDLTRIKVDVVVASTSPAVKRRSKPPQRFRSCGTRPAPATHHSCRTPGRRPGPLGVRLQPLEVRGPGEIEAALTAMTKERGAVMVLLDSMLVANRARISESATKSLLPRIYGLTDYARAGGLIAYGPNVVDMHRQADVRR